MLTAISKFDLVFLLQGPVWPNEKVLRSSSYANCWLKYWE